MEKKINFATEKQVAKFQRAASCASLNLSSFAFASANRIYDIKRGKVKMTEEEYTHFMREILDLKNMYSRMHVGTTASQVRSCSSLLNDPRLKPYTLRSIPTKWEVEQVLDKNELDDKQAKEILKKISLALSKMFQELSNLI